MLKIDKDMNQDKLGSMSSYDCLSKSQNFISITHNTHIFFDWLKLLTIWEMQTQNNICVLIAYFIVFIPVFAFLFVLGVAKGHFTKIILKNHFYFLKIGFFFNNKIIGTEEFWVSLVFGILRPTPNQNMMGIILFIDLFM